MYLGAISHETVPPRAELLGDQASWRWPQQDPSSQTLSLQLTPLQLFHPLLSKFAETLCLLVSPSVAFILVV